MENISEKPKRGRPVKYNPECLASFDKIYPHYSRRGLVEILLHSRAAVVVNEAAKCNPQKNAWIKYFMSDPTGERIFHKTVLAALGRIEQKRVLIKTAKVIATRRLRTAEALQEVRRVCYRLAVAALDGLDDEAADCAAVDAEEGADLDGEAPDAAEKIPESS